MSSPNPTLSDLEDLDPLPTDANEGYASDEAIEDTNFRDGNDEAKDKKVVDPSTAPRKPVQNPQPKLDAERLKNAKGIHAIEEHFEGFKFGGKGYEKYDLDKMMKKLEYWSHRLFPKFQFDDCLSKLETLGTKKAVQTHLKKIRLGMWSKEDIIGNTEDIPDRDVIEDEDLQREDSAPIDEFDALIAEQLEKQKQASAITPQRQNVPSTAFKETSKKSSEAMPMNVSSSSASNGTKPLEITEEIRERIERNRQLAIRKRLARIEAEKEARSNTIDEKSERADRDNQTPNTDDTDQKAV